MDTAVSLVQAYLQLCGYFTVTEYPVIESIRGGGYRTVTDLDLLAIRYPGARRIVPGNEPDAGMATQSVHPTAVLDPVRDQVDMVIGEVKEGRAELNRGARNPDVLRTVLVRFGCCDESQTQPIIDDLLTHGAATLPNQHAVRLVAFGSRVRESLGYPCEVIYLHDVVQALQEYLREHWSILRHAELKHPALSMLMTIEKAVRSHPDG